VRSVFDRNLSLSAEFCISHVPGHAHFEQETLLLMLAAVVPAGVVKVEAPTKLVVAPPDAAGACNSITLYQQMGSILSAT